MNNEQWDYRIDGKTNGIIRVFLPIVLAVVFTILAIDQLKPQPNKFMFIAIAFGNIVVISLYLSIKLSIRYFCFKIYIGNSGFYFKSNPWNGEFYIYEDIVYCKQELKTRLLKHGSGVVYYYFFVFKNKSGKTTKFQFDKSVCEREINDLQRRINKATK